MRVRTHRSRTSVRLSLAIAMSAAVMMQAAPASANHCSGGGQIDDRGGDVVAECHGRTPGEPGTWSVHEAWDI